MNMNYVVKPASGLKGQLRVPGDKSMSHRSIIFAALASGRSHIKGFLQGEDTLATKAIFQKMGVKIDQSSDELTIDGVGLSGLTAPENHLDCGNSGTGMRLLAGLLSGQKFESTLVGDHSLMSRPMARIGKPLMQMGANIALGDEGRPPIHIKPVECLKAIEYALPVASAQVKSAILLAGMYAEGKTVVIEPRPTRDHTETMMQAFGVDVVVEDDHIEINPPEALSPQDFEVPADISSAAFWLVAGSIIPGSKILLTHVGLNPRRDGIVHLLRLMGADIQVDWVSSPSDPEPIANLTVQYARLNGIEIPKELIANAIDEFPVLFVAAAMAEGRTSLRGAEELRVKESDRIAVMARGLQQMGVELKEFSDGIEISGSSTFKHASVDSHGDHRCAMAFTIAGLAGKGCIVKDCENVATSYPTFADDVKALNADLESSHE